MADDRNPAPSQNHREAVADMDRLHRSVPLPTANPQRGATGRGEMHSPRVEAFQCLWRPRSTCLRSPLRSINRKDARARIRPSAFIGGLLFLFTILSLGIAKAETFPIKPVRIIVPYSPGSAIDLIARVLAGGLKESWQQPVVVENRPGAGGQIAAAAVARATPDGYTLMVGAQSLAISKLTTKNLPYDPIVDFAPITKLATYKIILATNAKMPANDLKELAVYSRENPGKLNYGGVGPSTIIDVSIELIKKTMDIDIQPVQYQGTPQTVTALLQNEVHLVYNTAAQMRGFLDNGTIKPLAAISHVRFSDMPNVPTLKELGYNEFVPETWTGLFAPAGTPREIVSKIAADVAKLLASPDVRSRLESTIGVDPRPSTAEAFKTELETEVREWSRIFREAGISPQ